MKVGAKARPARDHPEDNLQKRSLVWLTDPDHFGDLTCKGYSTLAQSPEVSTAVNAIARLIGAMTIHLMRNSANGDVRIRNEISDVVDIEPNRYMTRSNLMQWIIRTMLLDGRGNAVVWPRTENGRLRELIPVAPAGVSFVPSPDGFGYTVAINGVQYEPENVLHSASNPGSYYPWLGQGFTVSLTDVANNLKQAAATEKGFMQSKWKPSLIVKVDGMFDEMGNAVSRKKLLADYVESTEAGEPWLIPAEQFQIQEVKPLTLSDLALADFVRIDKRTVASILGVPAFVLGVADFRREEWNSFVSTTVMPIALGIQQELTRKLLTDRDLYFRFSSRSLYNYDLRDLAAIADDQFVRGIMTGNEVRDWIGLSPRDGLDELVILENYIPRNMLAQQSKLQDAGGGESE